MYTYIIAFLQHSAKSLNMLNIGIMYTLIYVQGPGISSSSEAV